MLASSRTGEVSHLAMEKTDNIEFYISCYFGVIFPTVCEVLRHFIAQPCFHAYSVRLTF